MLSKRHGHGLKINPTCEKSANNVLLSSKYLRLIMLEPKKHIKNIVSYPIDKEIEWDLKLDFNENLIGPSPKVLKAIRNISIDKIKYYPFYET